MKTIAILLTVYNRKEKTLACLERVFQQVGFNNDFLIDVFLVDDGSTDGTSDAVANKFSAVNLIQGNGSLFWNRGMHLAWREAAKVKEYDYFLWLNDDSFIYDATLQHLLECAQETKSKAIICGFLHSAHDAHKTTYGGRLDNRQLDPNGQLQKINLINGNVVLIPKEVYHKIGILDPVFPHAIGDFDYGMRAVKAGIQVVTTKKYIATCELNPKLPAWCYSDTPLFKRLKTLYSPLGNAHPYYFFVYENRYFGSLTAIKHLFSIHLRALIPQLWK